MRLNIRCVMLSGDANDLRQLALDVQLERAFIPSLSHTSHIGDIFEPFHGGRASKADLYIVLVEIFERRDMIDRDQPPFADDGDAVAGLLYFWENVRGEEDRASLSANFGYHFREFLLVEWIEATGRFVQDEQARLVHKGLHQPQFLFVAV